ncbi:MAG: LCP family protein [Bifidobacteriaceae bacterium]|nr:LCP family protein [Bifidobacteriaceae bacterium]
MQPRHAAAQTNRPSRHLRRIRRRRAGKIVATVVVSTMLAAFVAVGERIRQLDANISSLTGVEELLKGRPTPKATTTAPAAPGDPFGGKAVNILIVAVDTRSGDNADIAGDHLESQLNDVNMVAHISADRSRVDIMSIPRDTMAPMSECTRLDGTVASANSDRQINEAFSKASQWNWEEGKTAGMACVVQTIEDLTGIYMDSYILVDFAGFAGVVDGLGGVDLCLPEGLTSRKARLNLEPGMHSLNGRTALQVARTRSGSNYWGKSLDGSDLSRINRQQQLIAAVINETLQAATLTRIGDLNKAATAITQSLYIGPGLDSVTALAGLAYSLRKIDPARISLFMVPVVGDGMRVRLAQSSTGKLDGATAAEVFEDLAWDRPVPGTAAYKALHPDPTTGPSAGASPGTSPSASPDTGATEPNDEIVTPSRVPATCEVVGQG